MKIILCCLSIFKMMLMFLSWWMCKTMHSIVVSVLPPAGCGDPCVAVLAPSLVINLRALCPNIPDIQYTVLAYTVLHYSCVLYCVVQCYCIVSMYYTTLLYYSMLNYTVHPIHLYCMLCVQYTAHGTRYTVHSIVYHTVYLLYYYSTVYSLPYCEHSIVH